MSLLLDWSKTFEGKISNQQYNFEKYNLLKVRHFFSISKLYVKLYHFPSVMKYPME